MKSRLNLFFTFFVSVIGIAIGYIGWRIAESTYHWIILWIMAVFLLLLPVMHWRAERYAMTWVRKLLQQASYLSMGVMSWLFFLVLLRDFLLLICYWTLGRELATRTEEITRGDGVFMFSIVISGVGILWAYRGLKVRNIIVPMFDLPKSLSNFRIVQISDLHVGPTIGGEYVERVVASVNELKPDITVLTGDIVDGRLADLKIAASALENLEPKGKVFFVPGNHEYYWALNEWIEQFEAWGIKVLLNRGELLLYESHSVWVGGVSDPTAARLGARHAPNASLAAQGGEHADLRLLLSHRPGMAAEASHQRFHLQLSGHTHGGQFFPWTYIAKLFHQYYIGLMKHEDMWIYVSPGTGSWGPPMRLGTTPEVTCLELVRSEEMR